MHTATTYLFAFVLFPALASAGPSYINSRGDLVELDPAPAKAAAEFHRAGLISPAGAVFRVPGMPRHIFLERGVIVRIQERLSISPANLLAPAGLTPVRRIDPAGTMLLCEAADASAALSGSKVAAKMPEVEWALPDFTFPVELAYQPNDPYYVEQWYHYQPSGAHMHSEEAWDITMGDPQVVVAVLDTGLDSNHPDLAPERILTGYNTIDGSSDVTPGPRSNDSHGTCCAGLVAASADNDEGVAGTCPRCTLLPIKLPANLLMSISTISEAFYHAVSRGAWVSSSSWGIPQEYLDQIDLEPAYQAIRDFVALARDGRGGVALFASANFGRDIGPGELANLPEVMAVGGTDYNDTVVSYSNFGSNLSVVAPTASNSFNRPAIISTDTTGDKGYSRAGFFWSAAEQGDIYTGQPEPDITGNYTRYFGGTSAATPIAAGVVALVFSANPDLTGEQARMIVEKTADKVGGVFYDSGGHNNYYGYGRVNAARSTRAAGIGFGNPAAAICAENLNCASGVCMKAVFTDPFGQCWVDCGELPDGTECYDGNKCTENDICSAGRCSGSQIVCDDDNICTDDFCYPAEGCVYASNQAPCDDKNACTENDTCSGGSCAGSPLNCDDENPCTDDACDPASGCTHTNNLEPCVDGDTCTEGDRCNQGRCVGGDNICEEGCGCAHVNSSLSWLAFFGFILLAIRMRRSEKLAAASSGRPGRKDP